MKEKLDNARAEHEALKLQYEGAWFRQDYEKSLSNIQNSKGSWEQAHEYARSQEKARRGVHIRENDYEFS